MTEHTAQLLSVALVLVALVAIPVAGLAVSDTGVLAQESDDPPTANETADDVAPGERLSGVIGVGEAEVDNEVDSRAFGIQVARAASEDAQADVVAEGLGETEARIDALEQRKAALQQARDNGSMSEGAYQARMAKVAAELRGAEQLANQSETTARGLPEEVLAENGIDVEAIQQLRDRANELGGQEVAEMARNIAGAGAGGSPGDAGPEERGPPERATDAPDRADSDGETSEPDEQADADGTVGNETATDQPAETPGSARGTDSAPAR